jgi:hypothetical protein
MSPVRKWCKYFNENVALEMLMDIIDNLSTVNKGWLSRSDIVTTLKQHVQNTYPEAYSNLGDPEYGNIVDWLGARYTEITRLRPILRRLEKFINEYDRQKIMDKWAYRKR